MENVTVRRSAIAWTLAAGVAATLGGAATWATRANDAADANAALSCDGLASLALPHTSITSASVVSAGGFQPSGGRGGNAYAGLPAFCRAAAGLTPSSDSDIKVEVWLPASGWNGKYQAVGNGGWAGTIGYAAMARALARGYATSGTDGTHRRLG